MKTLLQVVAFLLVMAGLLIGYLLMTAGWSWQHPATWLVPLVGACLFEGLLYAIYNSKQMPR